MATLSKHGVELGRIEYLTKTKAWFANGDILINRGDGWKEYGKVKPGFAPKAIYLHQAEYQREYLQSHPCFEEYRRELHEMAGITNRWKLHTAVTLMPDDPDGVWSEVCDGYGDNLSASVDEVVHLCHLYQALVIEHQAALAAQEN